MTRYKDLPSAVEALKNALRPAQANIQIMEAIVSLAQVSNQLSAKDAKKVFTTLIPEIASSARSGEFQIAMESLQKAYDAEVRGKMKFANELDWFLKSRSMHVAELRRLLVNLDLDEIRYFLQVTGERALHYNNVVRNDYLPEIAKAFQDTIEKSGARLKRLLEGFSAEVNEVIQTFQKTGYITDYDFWRIKGEIMEMLTLPMKQIHLQEILEFHPKAVPIEKVMAKTKLTKEGRVSRSEDFLQIWDGIIAEITDQGLNILVKFEVKSGLHGFRQGFEQIMQTQYNRFGSFGDELRVTLKGGTERIFKLSSKSGKPGSIKGITSENILITPKGESSMLPNQAVEEGDFKFKTLLLELGGREVDHNDIEALVMDLLMGYKTNPQ